jgi:hypothetical protein
LELLIKQLLPQSGVALMNEHSVSLIEEPLPYELDELHKWQSNDDNCIDILLKSNAPLSIKRTVGYKKGFIIDESGKRLGRRKDNPCPRGTMHFDVAKTVVDNLDNIKLGWYGSYDWLKSPGWIVKPSSFVPTSSDNYSKEFERIYQKALIEYIGIPNLKKLQGKAKMFEDIAEPDLWLIKKDGTFLFIEAKINKRTVEDSQIAGLALLKNILSADVKIIRAYQKDKNVKKNDWSDKFSYYYNLL